MSHHSHRHTHPRRCWLTSAYRRSPPPRTDMTRQLGLLAGLLLLVGAQKYEGEPCMTADDTYGECKRIASCDSARLDIQNGRRPEICSYDRSVPIVCCADPTILSAPATPPSAPLWPSEGVAPQRPAQGPPVMSGGRPPQRPQAQRPPVTSGGRPPQRPPATEEPAQAPPVTSGEPPKQPSKRPQWWQIPTRKRTESPAVIDNLATTPMSGAT